jgi:hypothetical protein
MLVMRVSHVGALNDIIAPFPTTLASRADAWWLKVLDASGQALAYVYAVRHRARPTSLASSPSMRRGALL